jgi:CBS domain containing-hemolysin-like protein
VTTVDAVMTPRVLVAAVDAEASARAVERRSVRTGRSRLAVVRADGQICGFVHVRDAARATTFGPPATAARLMSKPLSLPAGMPAAEAVRVMRDKRVRLATVSAAGTTVGVVALDDLICELLRTAPAEPG